jgi:hypothetical protein
MGEEEQKELELPLQSNSGRHPTPLFWYLGFHGNGSHLEFFQPIKSFHKLTAAILKLNICLQICM